ncbi:unnamed protein product, partial [Discosporangium mesarthrocarpum]
RHRTFVHKLRQCSSDKIDLATAHVLNHWDEISGGDEEFDRLSMRKGDIRVGVWLNTTLKGFRLKTLDFSEACMSTDVPRPLSGARVAVRNIFLPY